MDVDAIPAIDSDTDSWCWCCRPPDADADADDDAAAAAAADTIFVVQCLKSCYVLPVNKHCVKTEERCAMKFDNIPVPEIRKVELNQVSK